MKRRLLVALTLFLSCIMLVGCEFKKKDANDTDEPQISCQHVLSDWIDGDIATCTTDGYRYKICTVCGDELDREVISATDHTYSDTLSFDDNYHWYSATCGHNVVKDKTSHILNNGSCECGYTELVASVGLSYTLSDDGTYYIVSGIGTCTDADIVIPELYNDKPVKEIGVSAFEDCSNLTSMVIPDSLTSIGYGAFAGCNSALYTEENNLKYVKANGNPYCILIGTTDSNLSTYQINSNTKHIGGSAFDDCISLTSVEIGDSVTSIGIGAFSSCFNLTKVNYTGTIDGWVQIEFGLYYSNPTSNAKNLYINDQLVTTANITTATYISNCAFYRCTSLTNVTIGNSVTSIGSAAFWDCDGLTNVTIGDSVTSIGSIAFEDCDGLTNVTIGDSVTSIGIGAFANCDNLTSIVIPDSVTSIGYGAFYNCDSLTSVIIPDSVTSIGNQAFCNCDNLTNVTFSDTSDWYVTKNETDWQNKTGGTLIDVTSPTTNDDYLKSTYYDYYWYKK